MAESQSPPSWCLTPTSHCLAGERLGGAMPVCSGDRRPARTSPEDIARTSELLEKSRDLLLIPYGIEGCSPVTRMGMRWAGDGHGRMAL